jgi:hypothetical protein
MSHAGMILGIPGPEIERVKRREGIEVWAKPCWSPSRRHCGGTHATLLNPTRRFRRPVAGPYIMSPMTWRRVRRVRRVVGWRGEVFLGRHLVSAENYRFLRQRAFASWESAVAI